MSDTDDLRDLFVETTGEEEVTDSQEQDLGRMVDEAESAKPSTSVNCPECSNDRAYYEMKQIRAADESETRFFECTECGHKWREDDH